MAETYGELITRLCQLRDEMYTTAPGREALAKVRGQLAEMAKAQQRGGGTLGAHCGAGPGQGRERCGGG